MDSCNIDCGSRSSACSLLVIVPAYASYRAFLRDFSEWLVTRGWQVHVATNLKGATVEQDVATLHHVAMPRGACPLRMLRASRVLSKLVRSVQPTVVHAHFSVGMLCLALSKRVPGVRYLGTFQGMRFPLASGVGRWIFRFVECFSILRLDQSWVLTADDYLAAPKSIRKKLSIQEGYGFGCDIAHFDPVRFSDIDKVTLRDEIGIRRDDFVFIFVGRLTAFKGFDLVLKAFQYLRKKRKGIRFLVVGETDPVHPLDLPDLNSIEGVHHVGWKNDPAPYFAIANAMVFPSEREGMPVCVMEALSMGLTVIGGEARGTAKLINDFGGVCIPLNSSVNSSLCVKMTEVIEAGGACRRGNSNRAELARELYFKILMREYVES